MKPQTSAPGRRRRRTAGAAAVTAAMLAAGCSSNSTEPSAASVPAVKIARDAGVAYVHGLDDATRAMSGIAAAVLDPSARAGTRGPRIEAELTRLEAAAALMQPLTLDDAAVDDQRSGLLVVIPPFESAMRAVLAAGRQDAVNGGLELVRQRAPILAGVDAMLAADAGAIDTLGNDARAALAEARDDLQRRLVDLRSQAAR